MHFQKMYQFFLCYFALSLSLEQEMKASQPVSDPFIALSNAWNNDPDSYTKILTSFIQAYCHFTEAGTPQVEHNYLSYAFANHSQFLAVYNQMLEQLLNFIRQRTKQFTKDYYVSSAAQSFIMVANSAEGQSLQGQLLSVDMVAKTLSDNVDAAFLTLQQNPGSVSQQMLSVMQTAYKTYYVNYKKERNTIVTQWIISLFQTLASTYNPALFEQNLKQQLTVPDVERLHVYMQLLQASLDTTTTDGAQMMSTALGYYADIAGYATLVLCQQAGALGVGHTIALPLKQADPHTVAYNPNLEVAVSVTTTPDQKLNTLFQTYNKQNQKTFKRYEMPCFVKSRLFLDTLNQFHESQEKIQKIMAQYSFGFVPRPHMSFINLVDVLTKRAVQDPSQAVAQFQQGHANHAAQNNDGRIISLLMQALSTCKAAIDLYTQANNGLMVSIFTAKQQMLSLVLSNFQAIFSAFNQAEAAPEYTATSAGTKAAYYGQAEQLLTGLGSYLLTAQQTDLALYVKKLAARAGIMRYASWIKGYVTYYGPYIARYLDDAQVLQLDSSGNLSIDGTLQTYLQEIITFFQQIVPGMIAVYQDELAFYMSLTEKDQEITDMIDVLQTAITVSIYFNKALSYIDASKEAAADNYTLAIQNRDNATGLLYLLEAKKKYTAALGYFEMIDDLLNAAQQKSLSYQASLLSYVPFITLFSDSQKKRLQFKDFILLHQAYLYASVGQLLVKRPITALAPASYVGYLLCNYSFTLYSFLGKTDNVSLVKQLIEDKSFIFACRQEVENSLKSPSFFSLFHERPQAVTDAKSFSISEQKYELAHLLCGAFLSMGDFRVYELYETLLDYQNSWYVTLGSNNQQKIVPKTTIKLYTFFISFYKAVVAFSKKDSLEASKNTTFLLNNISMYKQSRDAELSRLSDMLSSGVLTEAIFNQGVERLALMEKQDALFKQLLWFLQLDSLLFGVDIQIPDLSLSSLDEKLGDLYVAHSKNLFREKQKAYSNGTFYAADQEADFKEIEAYLAKAATYYMQCNQQEKYNDVSLMQTDVKGLQKASGLIPLYIINVSGDLAAASTMPVNQLITAPSCFARIGLSDMLVQYDVKKPLFVLTSRTITVPDSLSSEAQQLFSNQSDAATMIAFSLKVYAENLKASIAGKTVTDDTGTTVSSIDSYIKEYQDQVQSLVAGIPLCGTTLHVSCSLEKETVDGKTVYTLRERNVPVPAFPRFNLDPYSAFNYYKQECLPLYSKSSNPINIDGSLYIPDAQNVGMQSLISDAILNTYLLATIPVQKKIADMTNQSLYTTLQTMDDVQRNALKFADYHDLYTQFQNSYQTLLGYYGSLEDLFSQYQWSKIPIYHLQAKAYVALIKINSFFAGVGDPTDLYFSVGMNTIINYVQEVIALAGLVKNSAYVWHAQTTLAHILECAGDQANLVYDTNFATTNYPSQTAIYPLMLPNHKGAYKWQKAANFYQQAASRYALCAKTNPLFNGQDIGITFSADQVAGFQKSFNDMILKQAQTWAKAGAFCLATFGYNAFQECRCGINKDGSFDVISVQQPEPPRFPEWAYPYPGEYPVCAATAGVTYPALDQLHQGVASQRTTLFDTIMNTGLIDAANDSADASDYGTDQSDSGQASVAYGIMKNMLVWSIYYYTQAVDVIQKLSIPKLVTAQDKQNHQDTLSSYIIKVLSTEPGFLFVDLNAKNKPNDLKAINPKNLPVLYVPNGIKKSGKLVSGFQLLYELGKVRLSLTNPAQFYMHTICYWASLPQFEESLMEPVLKWTDQSLLNPLASWLSELSFLARRFYQYVYLYSEDSTQAQLDMNTAVSTINQSHFVVSDQYVG